MKPSQLLLTGLLLTVVGCATDTDRTPAPALTDLPNVVGRWRYVAQAHLPAGGPATPVASATTFELRANAAYAFRQGSRVTESGRLRVSAQPDAGGRVVYGRFHYVGRGEFQFFNYDPATDRLQLLDRLPENAGGFCGTMTAAEFARLR